MFVHAKTAVLQEAPSYRSNSMTATTFGMRGTPRPTMHPASILRVSGCQCDCMNLNFQKDRFPAILALRNGCNRTEWSNILQAFGEKILPRPYYK